MRGLPSRFWESSWFVIGEGAPRRSREGRKARRWFIVPQRGHLIEICSNTASASFRPQWPQRISSMVSASPKMRPACAQVTGPLGQCRGQSRRRGLCWVFPHPSHSPCLFLSEIHSERLTIKRKQLFIL